jgi:uncharacterized protein (DUF1501 family)
MTDEPRNDDTPAMMPTPDGRPAPFEHDWTELDRRRFLKLMGAGGAVAAGAAAGLGDLVRTAPPAAAATTPRLSAAAAKAAAASPPQRVLVALDCAGGNDGTSMLFPHAGSNSAAYVAARPEAHLDLASALDIDGTYGLHPGLAKLHSRGAAWIQGVGIPNYDLSHFESLRRWWAGDMVDGTVAMPGGFLARVCDAIGDSTVPAVGVTIGYGPTAAFSGSTVATVPCDPYGPFALPIPLNGYFDTAFANAMQAAALPNGGDTSMAAAARKGSADLLRFLGLLSGLPAATNGYPDTTLGTQLELAARIIGENAGVRVIHIPVFGDFDTHKNHLTRYVSNMKMIDDALDMFLNDLTARGLLSSTLVMQYSEFGRRGISNNSAGLDHGNASVFFMAGAANAGLYGTYPSYASLDANDNLVQTVTMKEYYATAAQSWFGVTASSVLTGSPSPIPGIVS